MRYNVPREVVFESNERFVRLTPARVEDAEQLVEAIDESRQALRSFMPWSHYDTSNSVAFQRKRLATIVEGFERGHDLVMHGYDADDTFVISVGLHARTLSPLAGELGLWVRSAATGRGIATLASQMLTGLAFEHFQWRRVQYCHHALNEASARIVQKLGFRHEGTLRHFEDPGDERMRRDGYRCAEGATLIYGVTSDEYATLPWRSEIGSAMRVAF